LTEVLSGRHPPSGTPIRQSAWAGLWTAVAAIAIAQLGTWGVERAAAARFAASADELRATSGDTQKLVADFYRKRGYKPLWLVGDRLRPEADLLVAMLVEGIDEGLAIEPGGVARLLRARRDLANGVPGARHDAELLLSGQLVAYAAALDAPPEGGVVYVDEALKPVAPDRRAVLDQAASAGSLAVYLRSLQRRNPLYEALRKSLRGASPEEAAAIRLNLQRLRAIPVDPGPRYVVVDAAGAKLWLFDRGRISDSMKVVVGRRDQQTPAMAALIRQAVYNPYWNVPSDLVQDKVAPEVLRQGDAYVRHQRFQLLSDYSPNAQPLAIEQVDWTAVAEGRRKIRVRQLPGAGNMLGKVKFMFPNRLGVYLHDTSDRAAMKRSQRLLSSGCVRVEDAQRLARWLFEGADPSVPPTPEFKVPLPRPVPVYITYLTRVPGPRGAVAQDDLYGRDEAALRVLETRSGPASLVRSERRPAQRPTGRDATASTT
jgi:murein L,D-transpeptidase YcbB/YkuD